MKKKAITICGIAVACAAVCLVVFLCYTIPKKDHVQDKEFPREYLITDTNEIDYQTDHECAAYACAYVLRHMHISADGNTLYPDIKRIFGFVPVSSLVEVLKSNGLDAAAYHGTIDTLKQRLCKGKPVIVFTSIPDDTHYMTAIGYDENNIYFVDSLKENSNISNEHYNRVLAISEFERIWKTNMYFIDNIYVVVE